MKHTWDSEPEGAQLIVNWRFTLRRLSEKYAEFGKYWYVCYIDFQKAFDSVWRARLWHTMRFLGYSDKIVRVLQALYENTMSAVRVDRLV